MDGADILGIVALAISGGAGAYVVWYISCFGLGSGGQGERGPGAVAAGEAAGPEEMPITHDPMLASEIAALRSEIAGIAATQARMLEQQSDREGMLLAEMRAVASVMDPNIVESLARIESSVSGKPPAPSSPGPDDDDNPDEGATPRDDANRRPEGERLYVVPGARGPDADIDPGSGKTIRRG